MDAYLRSTQGSDPAAAAAAAAGWRAKLQPEARSRIVDKILETLTRHTPLPVSEPEGLNELRRIAERFEEEIYDVAVHQSDYLRKISLTMLSMDTRTQQATGNAQAIPNQNNPGQASADSTAQTDHAGGGDWQEEIYQMIKSLKNQHFAELNKLFDKVSVKLQHVDSIIPHQIPTEQYERMKKFKTLLDRILQVLLVSKSTIQPAMRDKVPQYEKQIISILNSQKRKSVQPQVQPEVQQQFQPPAGQAPNSSISQQWQPSLSLQQHDSHTNPQASLSGMSIGLQSSSEAGIQHAPAPPTTNFSIPTLQNGAHIQRQAGSDSEADQGGNFNSLQYGSMSGALQQRNAGPMQATMSSQLQTGSSSMLSHLSGQRKHMTKRRWHDTFDSET